MTFGKKLYILRKEKGMSQEELAAQISVSRQAVSKWELDESSPDISNILQLSKIFNVTTDYLLKEDEQQQNPGTHVRPGADSGYLLFIGSTAMIAIGLMCAFGGWYEQQTAVAIWGSMIIQAVGWVGYIIGQSISRQKAPFTVKFANIAITLFMPISMIVSVLWGHPIRPYPTDISLAITFAAVYAVALALCYILLKKREAHR